MIMKFVAHKSCKMHHSWRFGVKGKFRTSFRFGRWNSPLEVSRKFWQFSGKRSVKTITKCTTEVQNIYPLNLSKLWNTNLLILDKDMKMHCLDSEVKLWLKMATVNFCGWCARFNSKLIVFVFIPEVTSNLKPGWVQGHIDIQNRISSRLRSSLLNQPQDSWRVIMAACKQANALLTHHRVSVLDSRLEILSRSEDVLLTGLLISRSFWLTLWNQRRFLNTEVTLLCGFSIFHFFLQWGGSYTERKG